MHSKHRSISENNLTSIREKLLKLTDLAAKMIMPYNGNLTYGHETMNMFNYFVLTSMEQPMRDPFRRALNIIWKRSRGVFDFSSYRSATPPVKSVKASLVRPPLNASYEPFNLNMVHTSNTGRRFISGKSLQTYGTMQSDRQKCKKNKHSFDIPQKSYYFKYA